MTPEQEQQEREAFEAWVIEGELAYRDPYGLWFYASGDGRAYWEGWQARAALVRSQAIEDAAKVCEAIRDEYQRRESLLFSENKTDAQEGADDCAAAIRGMR